MSEIEEEKISNKTVIKYIEDRHYERFIKNLMEEKKSFIVEKTNYTKKISFHKKVFFFNENGTQDFYGLQLLNKVRKDAKKYMESTSINKPENIRWSKLIDTVPVESVIAKVDVKGAYWNFAIQNGIVSEETNRYLLANYTDSKTMKTARLRALGSLATRKKYYSYIDGRLSDEPPVEKVQETFDLYMNICEGIDRMMFDISSNVEGAFFYYWDCIFSSKQVEKEIVDFVKQQGYHTKTDYSLIQTETIGRNIFIKTVTDQKIYLVKKEEEIFIKDKHLVTNESIFENMKRDKQQLILL